jgi:hypothetical protein
MRLLVSSRWVERQKSPEVPAAARTILPEMT